MLLASRITHPTSLWLGFPLFDVSLAIVLFRVENRREFQQDILSIIVTTRRGQDYVTKLNKIIDLWTDRYTSNNYATIRNPTILEAELLQVPIQLILMDIVPTALQEIAHPLADHSKLDGKYEISKAIASAASKTREHVICTSIIE